MYILLKNVYFLEGSPQPYKPSSKNKKILNKQPKSTPKRIRKRRKIKPKVADGRK